MASPSSGTTPPVKKPDAAPSSAPGAAAAPSPAPARKGEPKLRNLDRWLYDEPFAFDFFQAVRILERLQTDKKSVGRTASPQTEVVRFKCHLSLNFPPSSIYDLAKPTERVPVPLMTVAFFGLYGPSGMLPRHYTELLLRIDREGKGLEKHALREFFDLFNHRYISLFYRAWEKYRFYIPYERGDYALGEPDTFTHALYSLVGMGSPALRNRLRVSTWVDDGMEAREEKLAKIDDLGLLYFGGFLAHLPRNAVSLRALLADFFDLPVEVWQFQGQWLGLERENQSCMGLANCALGMDTVAGERVWDVQSKFRVRLGPLRSFNFTAFLPDYSVTRARKAFFLLSHLVRLYAGPEFDFEVQLVLKAEDVPECHLADDGGIGPRLGWNTWVRSMAMTHDAEEAVFAGEELVWVGAAPPPMDN